MKQPLSRRNFLKATGMLSTGAVLAACAPGTQPTGGADTGAAAADTTSTDPGAGDRVQVDFMNWWGAHREPLMDQVIENFHELNPDILVENLVQPWDNRSERASTSIASSTPPAIIMTTRVETYKFAHEELIIPISEYVNASGINPDEIFYPSEIATQRWAGELWSFPLPTGGGNNGQYFYNKTMLREAGFDPEKPPRTWQELEDLARAITMADDIGIDTLGADVTQPDAAFGAYLYSNNGKYVTDDAKELLFNSPEGVEALTWMVDFTNEFNGGIENVREFWQGTNIQSIDFPYYNDKAAIVFGGVWNFGHINATNPEMWNDTDAWGAALLPYNGNNPDATNHGTSGISFAWGYPIPANLDKEVQDAAYRYVEFFGTHEDGGCWFLFQQERPSSVRECNQNEDYFNQNPYWPLVLESLDSDVSVPITPVQGEIDALFGDAIEEALFGVKSAEEAVNEAAEKGQGILDNFWSNI